MNDRHRPDAQVIPVDFRPHVVIVIKHKVYDLGPDAIGQPLEETYGAAVPRTLRGAKRYMTEDDSISDHQERHASMNA